MINVLFNLIILQFLRYFVFRLQRINFAVNVFLFIAVWRLLINRVAVARTLWNFLLGWAIRIFKRMPKVAKSSWYTIQDTNWTSNCDNLYWSKELTSLHIVGIDTRISLIYQTEFIQRYSRHLHVCQIKELHVQIVSGISEINYL